MRIFFALTVSFLLLLATASVAVACSCASSTPEEQFELSDRVFTGRVVSVEVISDDFGVTYRNSVEVREVWKGSEEPRVTVETRVFASCTFTLDLGAEYLIYAGPGSVAGTFSTNECQRTRLRAYAAEDIEKLGEPEFVLVNVESRSWSAVKSRYGFSGF